MHLDRAGSSCAGKSSSVRVGVRLLGETFWVFSVFSYIVSFSRAKVVVPAEVEVLGWGLVYLGRACWCRVSIFVHRTSKNIVVLGWGFVGLRDRFFVCAIILIHYTFNHTEKLCCK